MKSLILVALIMTTISMDLKIGLTEVSLGYKSR